VRARAALYAAAAIAVLSVMDAVIKGLAARFPTFEVTFFRYLVGSLVVIAVAAARRPGWPSREAVRANLYRAVLVVVTATSFFYGLGALPLAEALALSFLSPVFIAVFAVLALRERIDARIAAALGFGFCGMAVIVAGQPHGSFDGSLWGAAAILLSTVTYALSIVLLRARAQRDHAIAIVAIQNIAPAAMLAAPAAAVWVAPGASDWPALVAVGVLGVAGHLLMVAAYARAEAARLAPIEYTALVWAALLGYAFYAETPAPATFAGAGLIIAGALAVARR
jgi:drug/metabolite transporter (DMT)-like permease